MALSEEEIVSRALALAEAGNCMSHAAQKLGLSFNTLKRIARRREIVFPDGRVPSARQIEMARAAHDEVTVVPPTAADALKVGKAGEHLVCADLLARGYDAFLSDQGLPYDVIVDVGSDLVRIQVKTAFVPRNSNAKGKAPNLVYPFNVRRRGRDRKGTPLNESHCDLIAFVGLLDKAVAYFKLDEVSQTMALYPPGYQFYGKFVRKRIQSIDGFPPERVLP